MEIQGKVAIVTVGASGLGEATVRLYVAAGAQVAIFDMNDERGNALAAELGDSAIYLNVNVTDEAAVQMAQQNSIGADGQRGVIINTASIAAYEGQIGQAAYSASKGGVVGMTLRIARDLASVGIRVNAIVTGLRHTPLFDALPEPAFNSLAASTLFPKRLGKPEEIAHLSKYIVENDYTNAECIRMDSGIRMQPR